MLAYNLITRKRDGEELTSAEISDLVEGYVSGEIPDYQMAAFLMATYFQGMTAAETTALTEAYIKSGETLDFSSLGYPTSDKHSTGGVGDKVSLVLAPLVAACGVAVPMISGRGLGHTGGTLDKLESIPGMKTKFSPAECKKLLERVGFFIAAQTDNMVPADKKIYALRDVTATVESIPLIVASIMSKKLAEGAGSLVLDVKFGNGAFMRDVRSAKTLAKAMVDVGNMHGVPTIAILTDMNQPLGEYVGNSLEVLEAIRYLRYEHIPDDLHEITMALGSAMLVLAGKAETLTSARDLLENALHSGGGAEKFREFIAAQGGNPNVLERTELLPQAKANFEVISPKDGWVAEFDTFGIGMLGVEMGAGRKKMGDEIDPRVGFRFAVKVGTRVEKGQPLAVVFGRDEAQASSFASRLCDMIKVSPRPVKKRKLLRYIVSKEIFPFTWDAEL